LANVMRLAKAGKAFEWLVLPDTDHDFVNVTTHEFNSSWVAPVRKFIRGRIPCT
jgi:hypothetical protein